MYKIKYFFYCAKYDFYSMAITFHIFTFVSSAMFYKNIIII